MKKFLSLIITVFTCSSLSGQGLPNVYGINSDDTLRLSLDCTSLRISAEIGHSNPSTSYVSIKTKFFISTDGILDSTDQLLGTKSISTNGPVINWNQTFTVPTFTTPGFYYILLQHDYTNTIQESNETDNLGRIVLMLEQVLTLPHFWDFETSDSLWSLGQSSSSNPQMWARGSGYSHHLEGTHSGKNAWHTSKTVVANSIGVQYLNTPYFDLSAASGNLILNFWFKNHSNSNTTEIEYSTDCGVWWNSLANIPAGRDDDWDFMNTSLSSLSNANNVKFRFKFSAGYYDPEGLNIDDLYIGPAKADLTLERGKMDRFTDVASSTYTLSYYINNCGSVAAPASISSFYWSTDTILDMGDTYLRSATEALVPGLTGVWRNVTFTKPTSNAGKYYVLYKLDTSNVVSEMREYNNAGFFEVYQQPVQSIPYSNDFESQSTGWRHDASLGTDDWELGVPSGSVLNQAFSGSKAWVTNKNGQVSPKSRMHLYTPVYDLTTSSEPVLSFDMFLHGDANCACSEASTNLSYSIDSGKTWQILDTASQSFSRWYYRMDYQDYVGTDRVWGGNYSELLFDLTERAFVTKLEYNGRDTYRNTHYSIDISHLAKHSNIQFRFNLGTLTGANSLYNLEGALIDNFAIEEADVDLKVALDKNLMISRTADWIKFNMLIFNSGNSRANPTKVRFHLSADSILDTNDFIVTTKDIPAIRPDKGYYLTVRELLNTGLASYEYLLYELDSNDSLAEYNESNNIGAWALGKGGIDSFPYQENFNDSLTEGWHEYSLDRYNVLLQDQFRFRNKLSPGEPVYQSKRKSGEMFTDQVNNVVYINQVPFWHLETPGFDFSHQHKIHLSFDLLCTGVMHGNDADGGTLEYSTNGGGNFTSLTDQAGTAQNWFNNQSMDQVNNQPGWSEMPPTNGSAPLTNRWIDISFLRGEKNVVFRFKYRSKWHNMGLGFVQGMRFDNFSITATSPDYVALDSAVSINATVAQTNIQVNYTLKNEGDLNGGNTKLKFFWSEDSLLDPTDLQVQNVNVTAISMGGSRSGNVIISIPSPLIQNEYYLFYVCDADSTLVEKDESNNLGSYKINFPPFADYYAKSPLDSISAQMSKPDIQAPYSIINTGLLDGEVSETRFFWSTDSTFDSGDIFVQSVQENIILAGDTFLGMQQVFYPTPISQKDYYLFYFTDALDSIIEGNEADNISRVMINFDYGVGIEESVLSGLEVYAFGHQLFINSTARLFGCTLKLYSLNGQVLWQKNVSLNKGNNRVDLPENLASAMYVVALSNEAESVKTKVLLD
ncbi:CARDB domain-containing protein [Owenweeksia hongkongensis]|uniref:CARDB domain-containing protein n=1 Tax=Owenweeksia hongkongensis TaxID=253245 RepID=UPI003A8D3D65